MNRTNRKIIIFCHDPCTITKNLQEDFSKNILPFVQNALDDELFMFIKVNTDLEKPVHIFHSKDWITHHDLQNLISSFDDGQFPTALFLRDDKQDLSAVLHKVADSLPYLGTFLSVIFIFGTCEENDSQCKSFLSAAGAMKRLMEWHNAEAIITSLTSHLAPVGVKLSELDTFRLVDKLNLPCRPMLGWTGNIILMDKCEGKGFVLPGYQLECSDWTSFLLKKMSTLTCPPKKNRSKARNQPNFDVRQHVLGRSLEILQEIHLQTLPLFLLDNWTLLLKSKVGVSSSLVNYIKGMHQTGLLARLRVYTDVKEIPLCGQLQNFSTEAWKERITSNCSNLTEPEEINVSHEYKYVYFILLPPGSLMDDGDVSVNAQVLLSPHEINESVFQIFENIRGGNEAHALNSFELLLDSEQLYIEPNKFLHLLELYRESHGLLNFTKDEILGIQKELVQSTVLNNHFGNSKISNKDENIKWALESTLCPEKRILEAKESARTSLQNFPYLDSLSPAPHADNGRNKDSWDFDVVDLLQRFNQCKSLVSAPKNTIQVKGRGLCRFESQQDYSISWPNSQHLLAPDIYYYSEEADMMFEKRYSSIRDKLNSCDTGSSFVSPLKKKSRQSQKTAPTIRSSSRCFKGPSPIISEEKKHNISGLSSAHRSSPRMILLTHTKNTHLPSQNCQLTSESIQLNTAKDLVPRSSRSKTSNIFKQNIQISPRKSTKSLAKALSSTDVQSKAKHTVKDNFEITSSNLESCEKNKSDRAKRSQRHKMKLQNIIHNVLNEKGVKKNDKIFDACAKNLFNVSLVLLKTFTSSRNLTEEMKNVVSGQVDQIIKLELRRNNKVKL
ncbi:hypothetical protein Btru_072389 [Bulinus truncatus]|nr:hypothetical protein Btru_072389 [Bulinus truncatus]